MLRNRVGNPIQNSNFPTLSGLTLYGLLQVTRRMFWSSAAKLDQHRTIKAVKPIWQPRNLHLHQKPAILKCDLSVNKIFDMNLYLPKILFLFRGDSSFPNLKDEVFPPISVAIPIKHGFSSIIVIILYGSGCFSSYIAIILTLVLSISLLFLLAMLLFLNITSSSVKTFLRNIADGFLIS